MEAIDLDTLRKAGEAILIILGAASAALHVVSPFTKTKKDDAATATVDNWVGKVATALKFVVLPKKLK